MAENGPDLQQYLETRLNLLTKQIENMNDRFDDKLSETDVRYQQRFNAQLEATNKADMASEKRFESVNEFRKTLTDQTASFVTRNEYSAAHAALGDRIGKCENLLSAREARISGAAENRTDERSSVALIISGVMMLISLVVFAITYLHR